MKMPKLAFPYLFAKKFSCSAMFRKKEFAVVRNYQLARKIPCSAEHENNFMTAGPGFLCGLFRFANECCCNHIRCLGNADVREWDLSSASILPSRKHPYIILTAPAPFKPHFYIVQLRFTGVYIIFFSYFCSKT